MALIQSTAIPSGATAYELEQSLRFNDGDTPYLTKATSSTATHNDRLTVSSWIKNSTVGQWHKFFTRYADGDNRFYVAIGNENHIYIFQKVGGSVTFNYKTNARYRDVGAWYHILVSIDTG